MLKVIIPATVNTKTFPAAVAEGKVRFYRVRENGTTRNVPFLVGEERELAEAIVADRAEGKSVRAIATERHISVATVRRYIQELELTVQVESLNRSGIIRVFKDKTL